MGWNTSIRSNDSPGANRPRHPRSSARSANRNRPGSSTAGTASQVALSRNLDSATASLASLLNLQASRSPHALDFATLTSNSHDTESQSLRATSSDYGITPNAENWTDHIPQLSPSLEIDGVSGQTSGTEIPSSIPAVSSSTSESFHRKANETNSDELSRLLLQAQTTTGPAGESLSENRLAASGRRTVEQGVRGIPAGTALLTPVFGTGDHFATATKQDAWPPGLVPSESDDVPSEVSKASRNAQVTSEGHAAKETGDSRTLAASNEASRQSRDVQSPQRSGSLDLGEIAQNSPSSITDESTALTVVSETIEEQRVALAAEISLANNASATEPLASFSPDLAKAFSSRNRRSTWTVASLDLSRGGDNERPFPGIELPAPSSSNQVTMQPGRSSSQPAGGSLGSVTPLSQSDTATSGQMTSGVAFESMTVGDQVAPGSSELSSSGTLETVALWEIGEQFFLRWNGGDDLIQIQLHPAELGQIAIAVKRDGQNLSVEISADNAQTRELLTNYRTDLEVLLNQQGWDLSQFDVSSGRSQADEHSGNPRQYTRSHEREIVAGEPQSPKALPLPAVSAKHRINVVI